VTCKAKNGYIVRKLSDHNMRRTAAVHTIGRLNVTALLPIGGEKFVVFFTIPVARPGIKAINYPTRITAISRSFKETFT